MAVRFTAKRREQMLPVPVRKFFESPAPLSAAFGEMESLFDTIRQRAFDLFQERGRSDGFAVDDWLKAERELIWKPESEMVESEKEFQIRLAAPGLDAKDFEISALPECLVVRGQASRKEEKREGAVRFSEFSEKQLYREFRTPAPLDPNKVTATLDKGVLTIVAPKAAAEKEKKISLAAA
jgi:HSP20 family protein